MPVITMNVPCTITGIGSYDQYGQPQQGSPRAAKCAVIKLTTKGQHTTVRADSGATRGHADETTADTILLFGKNEQVGLENIVRLRGHAFKVISIRERFDVMGRMDHIEVRCSIE